jgi:chromosome segregation ATPase
MKKAIDHKDGVIGEKIDEVSSLNQFYENEKRRMAEIRTELEQKEEENDLLVSKLEQLEENFNIQYEELKSRLLRAEEEINNITNRLSAKRVKYREIKARYRELESNLPRILEENQRTFLQLNRLEMEKNLIHQSTVSVQDMHALKTQFEEMRARLETDLRKQATAAEEYRSKYETLAKERGEY